MNVIRFLLTAEMALSFQVVSSGQYITNSCSEVDEFNAYNPDRRDGPRLDCGLRSFCALARYVWLMGSIRLSLIITHNEGSTTVRVDTKRIISSLLP